VPQLAYGQIGNIWTIKWTNKVDGKFTGLPGSKDYDQSHMSRR